MVIHQPVPVVTDMRHGDDDENLNLQRAEGEIVIADVKKE